MSATEESFDKWLGLAKAGDSIPYHVGVTATGPGGLRLPGVVSDAWAACVNGLVSLVQKKLGPGLFEYRAQRTETRRKNPRKNHR